MSGTPPMHARTSRRPEPARRSLVRRASACASVAALLLCLCAAPVEALSPQDHPALARFIDDMVARHGFARAKLERLFAAVERRPQIVAAMERPREALPWHEYRRGFVNEERARLGARFWRENREALARAERHYGVPAEIIVAILGVETRYGAHTGGHKVLEALTTLMLDYPRRAEFFRRELEEFLLLSRELALDPLAVKGSYAGALGIPQFIPSSYREYAVDFDRDGRRDLFGNRADAIGSVAHFLQRHGWAAGQPVIERVRVAAAPTASTGFQTVRTLREWMDEGVSPPQPPEPAAGERIAALIALEGESETLYHLGYNNFYVITRYNRSQNYAMAVYELARMIRTLAEESS